MNCFSFLLLTLPFADARFFRGKLKSSSHFAGETMSVPSAEGKTFHMSADTMDVTGTTAYITEDIALNLGLKMPTFINNLRKSFKNQVDTGMLYCGADMIDENGRNPLRDTNSFFFAGNHRYQDSLVANDGIVTHHAMKGGKTQVLIGADIEARQCGSNNCLDGSLVAVLAEFIRAQGYHVRHTDICTATSSTPLDYCKKKIDQTQITLYTYQCPAQDGVSDQWVYDKKCSTEIDCDAATDCAENEHLCVASKTFLENKGCQQSSNNNIAQKQWTVNNADALNVVRRVIRYGVNSEAVDMDIPDYQTITGGDCSNLRGIVLSINGNKMHEIFLSEQEEIARGYWENLIGDVRKIIETIIVKITDLNGLNEYFYPLENSQVYQCDSEFSAFEKGVDMGGVADPKCDLFGTDYASAQGLPMFTSLEQRTNCFCRSFSDSGSNTRSVDEYYLQTDISQTECDNLKDTLPSAYTYCNNFDQNGDVTTWKQSLAALEAREGDMPDALNEWYTVTNNNGKTGKEEVRTNFDDSITGSGTRCGRVSNAQTATTGVKFSNKGGNCIPLVGIEHIVYRLEHEFINARAAADRKGTGNTYGDMTCSKSDGENTYSFRQLAYQWQRYNATGNGKFPNEGDENVDNIGSAGRNSQFYDNAQSKYQQMCSVDYTQILGGGKNYIDGDVKVADTLQFLGRIAGEAAYMYGLAQTEKNTITESETVMFSHLLKELTSTERDGVSTSHIINGIGKAAARHFMAITGHRDISGFTGLCSKDMELDRNIGAKTYKGCTTAESISMTVNGEAKVGMFGLYGATNLEKIHIKSTTQEYSFESMSFNGVGAKTDDSLTKLLLKTDKYDPVENNMTIRHASIWRTRDGEVQCGIQCDTDYQDFDAVLVPSPDDSLCPTCKYVDPRPTTKQNCLDTDQWGAKHCMLQNRVFSPGSSGLNRTDSSRDTATIGGFFSKQITRTTKIDAVKVQGNCLLKVIELYLDSTCKKVTFGDLTRCDRLTHIYVHRNKKYNMEAGTINTASTCDIADPVDYTDALFPPSLRYIYDPDGDIGAVQQIPKVTVIHDTNSKRYAGYADTLGEDDELCVKINCTLTSCPTMKYTGQSSTEAKPSGEEHHYLVSGDSTITSLTRECQYAKEVILPDSIPYLENGFLADLDLDVNKIGKTSGGYFGGCKGKEYPNEHVLTCRGGARKASFNIFVGEKLERTSTHSPLAPMSNWVSDYTTAEIWRRCPTMTETRSDMKKFPHLKYLEDDIFGNGYRFRYMPVVYGESYQQGSFNVEFALPYLYLNKAYGPETASTSQFGCFCESKCITGDDHGEDFEILYECDNYDGTKNNTEACACGDTSCPADSTCDITKGVGACSKEWAEEETIQVSTEEQSAGDVQQNVTAEAGQGVTVDGEGDCNPTDPNCNNGDAIVVPNASELAAGGNSNTSNTSNTSNSAAGGNTAATNVCQLLTDLPSTKPNNCSTYTNETMCEEDELCTMSNNQVAATTTTTTVAPSGAPDNANSNNLPPAPSGNSNITTAASPTAPAPAASPTPAAAPTTPTTTTGGGTTAAATTTTAAPTQTMNTNGTNFTATTTTAAATTTTAAATTTTAAATTTTAAATTTTAAPPQTMNTNGTNITATTTTTTAAATTTTAAATTTTAAPPQTMNTNGTNFTATTTTAGENGPGGGPEGPPDDGV